MRDGHPYLRMGYPVMGRMIAGRPGAITIDPTIPGSGVIPRTTFMCHPTCLAVLIVESIMSQKFNQ